MAKLTMDKLVALCKNRGYIFAGSEIYGGLANTWDYGPLGVAFKNNVKKAWWRKFVQESPYNTGLDCAILMNREVWVASGHVGGFNDPLMDCKACKARFRADKLIEDYTNGAETGDGWTNAELEAFINDHADIVCPTCGLQRVTADRVKLLGSVTILHAEKQSRLTVCSLENAQTVTSGDLESLLCDGRIEIFSVLADDKIVAATVKIIVTALTGCKIVSVEELVVVCNRHAVALNDLVSHRLASDEKLSRFFVDLVFGHSERSTDRRAVQ